MTSNHPNRILASYFPAIGRPENVSPVETGGFSGAELLKVSTASGSFCLRRWPARGMSSSRLAGVHRLIDELFRSGITVVPVPLPGRNGTTFVEDHGVLWQLEPWMPGEADFHKNPSRARLEAAFTTLARIHCIAESISPDGPRGGTPETIPERLRILRETVRDLAQIEAGLQRESYLRFLAAARQIATKLQKRQAAIEATLTEATRHAVPILPCLRDVWHDHLLFSGDTLTGLVDFGAVRPDTVAADLSRLAGSLFQSSFSANRSRWDEALSIYERTRPLKDAERRLIPILDESGTLLSGAHWLRARYVRKSPFDLPGVCQRLESIASRLESR